eukprot:1395338-Amorphochlora_amoeboformis.AAC.4
MLGKLPLLRLLRGWPPLGQLLLGRRGSGHYRACDECLSRCHGLGSARGWTGDGSGLGNNAGVAGLCARAFGSYRHAGSDEVGGRVKAFGDGERSGPLVELHRWLEIWGAKLDDLSGLVGISGKQGVRVEYITASFVCRKYTISPYASPSPQLFSSYKKIVMSRTILYIRSS